MTTLISGDTGVDKVQPAALTTGLPSQTGNSGKFLTTDGAGNLSWGSAGSFAAGTRLGFQQTSAPTGWTKDTTAAINDSILRLVTGTVGSGGSTAFSTWAAVTSAGATTLSTAQIPSHNHSYIRNSSGVSAGNFGSVWTGEASVATGNAGGGGSHTHSLSQSLKYYDFIIASKD